MRQPYKAIFSVLLFVLFSYSAAVQIGALVGNDRVLSIWSALIALMLAQRFFKESYGD